MTRRSLFHALGAMIGSKALLPLPPPIRPSIGMISHVDYVNGVVTFDRRPLNTRDYCCLDPGSEGVIYNLALPEGY